MPVELLPFQNYRVEGAGVKWATITIPEGTYGSVILTFDATPVNDPYARLCNLYINGVEVHRGITPSGGAIHSSEDLTPYLNILKGTVDIGVQITTGIGYWLVTVKITLVEGAAPLPGTVTPLLLTEDFSAGALTKTVTVTLPSNTIGAYLYIFCTQHPSSAVGTVKVTVDGVFLAEVSGQAWKVGQGGLSPSVADLTANASLLRGTKTFTIAASTPDAGAYFVVSASLVITTTGLAYALAIGVDKTAGIVGDTFTFTGFLSSDGSPVAGSTVNLYRDAVYVGSAVTMADGSYIIQWTANVEGVFSFHSEAPSEGVASGSLTITVSAPPPKTGKLEVHAWV